MTIFLIYFSLLAFHQVLAGTPVISLLEDDMRSHPLCQSEDLISCQKAQVDVDAILNNDPISFPSELTFEKTLSYDDESGTRIIELKASNDNSSLALITITDEDIVTISIGTAHGINYNLLNCGPDFYLWQKVNETFFGHVDATPSDFNQTETDRNKLDPALAQLIEESLKSNEEAIITIKLYYTPALRDSSLNLKATLANNIAQTNVILSNSRIPLKVRGICPELMNVNEAASARGRLDSGVYYFNNMADLYDGADVAMLVTQSCSFDEFCGFAATINVINPFFKLYPGPVGFAWTVAMHTRLAVFAHELGHLLGGMHNRGEFKCGRQCEGTFYGYHVRGLRAHTVMAYDGPNNPYEIQYFSSPSITVNGFPIGTPVDDVRSTILGNRFAVSQLGNDQCRRGCFDRQTYNNCWGWRQQGFCQQQYVTYMWNNCAFTCGFC